MSLAPLQGHCKSYTGNAGVTDRRVVCKRISMPALSHVPYVVVVRCDTRTRPHSKFAWHMHGVDGAPDDAETMT
jgi:hypothetical protein